MKITTKLIASFSTLIALSGVVGGVGYLGLQSMSRELAEVGDVRLPSVEGLLMIQGGFTGVQAANSTLMVDSFPEAKRASQKKFRSGAFESAKKGWNLYEPLPQTDEEARIWKGFVPRYNAWQAAALEVGAAIDNYEKAKAGKQPAEIAAALEQANAKFQAAASLVDGVDADLDALTSLNNRIGIESTAAGHAQAQRARVIMIGAMVGVVSVASILAALICVNISRNIRALIQQISAIQHSSDLTRRVNASAKDEIGNLGAAFNKMIDTLHGIISEVKNGASQIDAGGSQIASASQSLAQGASEQASNLQQISASLEQMAGQTQQSAENARQASTLAEENKKSADRGRDEMAQMNKAVSEIKQSSTEISKIIKVIDEIAFQTNLLALNAAVEAARAGEAGKGFAVVAEEVRNLAQRSAEAAKNTASMIEESVKRSENGVQIAGRVGQALEEITSSTTKVNTLLAEIATAATEQATGIGQVNQGVSQLDQVTQQNAGNSEEMASSAEELSAQVASLNELVAQFKVTEGARPVHAHTAPGKAKSASEPKKLSTNTSKTPVTTGSHVSPRTSAVAANAPVPTPESVIPMESDEVLASF